VSVRVSNDSKLWSPTAASFTYEERGAATTQTTATSVRPNFDFGLDDSAPRDGFPSLCCDFLAPIVSACMQMALTLSPCSTAKQQATSLKRRGKAVPTSFDLRWTPLEARRSMLPMPAVTLPSILLPLAYVTARLLWS
jgi:hypothetical protein